MFSKWTELQKTAVEASREAMKETETQLRKELGSGYDEAVNNAVRILELGGPELTSWLDETGAGNDPRFVKAFAKLGSLVSEDSLGRTKATEKGRTSSLAERIYPNQGK